MLTGEERTFGLEDPHQQTTKVVEKDNSLEGFRIFRFGENREIKLTIDNQFLLSLRKNGIGFRELAQTFINNLAEIQKDPRGTSNIDSRVAKGRYVHYEVHINRLCPELATMCGQSLVIKQGSSDGVKLPRAFSFTVEAYKKAQEMLSPLEKQVFNIIPPLALIEVNGQSDDQSFFIMPEIKGKIVADLGSFPENFLQVFEITEEKLDILAKEIKAQGIATLSRLNLICKFLSNLLLERGINVGFDCEAKNMMVCDGKVILFDLVPKSK